jgi:hypothetical protein
MRSILYFLFIVLIGSTSAFAQGIKLDFKLDERYLICHTVTKNLPRSDRLKDILELQKDVKAKFPELYQRLYNTDGSVFNPTGLRSLKWINPILSYVLAHPLYPKLKHETQNHLIEVKTEWDKNYLVTSAHMQQTTRLKFEKAIEVYIIHPDVGQGRYNSVSKTIGWGHRSPWPNYSTVYLWHEILHSYLESNQKTHALIELITDDDLRCFLNKCSYPPFTEEGHDYLRPAKKWIYDKYWKSYLADPMLDVLKLEKVLTNDPTLPTEEV